MAPRGAHVGDLARRVTHRRNELGLSTEELARRAGVDAWFLAYFEQSSDTTLSSGALLRLAVALDTTPFTLEGGQVDRPPGEGRAGLHPVLESLTSATVRGPPGSRWYRSDRALDGFWSRRPIR